MSEEIKLRTQAEINGEYTNYAAQLGHALFQIDSAYSAAELLKSKTEDLKKKMKELNQEKAQPEASGDAK